MISAQQPMPVLSAVGLLVAGGLVPVALSTYWVCNGAWTLGQGRSNPALVPHSRLAG